MEEYIDIITKQGKPTGKSAPKSEVHQKGYYHNTAHVWLFTRNNEVLLSQRSAKKEICPLMWDVSVAGHIDAGETAKKAAIRETKEEIGLELSESDLTKIGVFECFQNYDSGIIDNEFHNTFLAELDIPVTKLSPQVEEVEALKLISLYEFQWLINNIGINNHFVPSNKTYYQFVLDQLKIII